MDIIENWVHSCALCAQLCTLCTQLHYPCFMYVSSRSNWEIWKISTLLFYYDRFKKSILRMFLFLGFPTKKKEFKKNYGTSSTRYFLSFLYVLIFTFVYFHKRFLAWLCRLGLFAKSFVNNTRTLPFVLVVLPFWKNKTKDWTFVQNAAMAIRGEVLKLFVRLGLV